MVFLTLNFWEELFGKEESTVIIEKSFELQSDEGLEDETMSEISFELQTNEGIDTPLSKLNYTGDAVENSFMTPLTKSARKTPTMRTNILRKHSPCFIKTLMRKRMRRYARIRNEFSRRCKKQNQQSNLKSLTK